MFPRRVFPFLLMSLISLPVVAADLEPVAGVEGQPLAANVGRLLQALEFLGNPLPESSQTAVRKALEAQDSAAIQKALDPLVLLSVHINPESRVKVARGPADARIDQLGYTPVLVKVANEARLSSRLRISCPLSGPLYAGAEPVTLARQQQTDLLENANTEGEKGRIFDVEMYTSPPLTPHLSGLEVEYALALIYCSEAGRREATIGFDVGQGTQDLGFRGETPILFDVQQAVPVRLSIRDYDGTPTVARLTFEDRRGNVCPPQAKRLAPDFFFQPQIYRTDGDVVPLAPGTYRLTSCRGPEYEEETREITVHPDGENEIEVSLRRWVNPMQYGFYCGDHHIHGAGCSHYQSPTQGVSPQDMFPQVKGEGLNVGCVLTWGPCFDFQRNYFSPLADAVSEPLTILKYDLEISGFGSQALGHVCLLNLTNQTYPGSDGSKLRGWPTWTVPVLKWAKEQGGVTGYPHSDMRVDPPGCAAQILSRWDSDGDDLLSQEEAVAALLPDEFSKIDSDQDRKLSAAELTTAADRAGNELPNLVLPSMGGAGAMEIFVSTAEGVCDFISAMDTGRVGEWNTWYHLMNCGFPLKVSGETDFPCMSSRRVGQGRVYVRMGPGPIDSLSFGDWCRGVGEGRSYVSDGFAHALSFTVNGAHPGEQEVSLPAEGKVSVEARVAFAARLPRGVAYGTQESPDGARSIGDTVLLHAPRNSDWVDGGKRTVELVMNGKVVGSAEVPADGKEHDLHFDVNVTQSSWIALRQFPQMHTNPVIIRVAGRPIRASRASARWCEESVELLWKNRSKWIADSEKAAAREAYDRALAQFRQRAEEAGAPMP